MVRFLTLFISLTLLLIGSITSKAEDAVRCELSVYQTDSLKGDILLRADTSTFVKGISTTGFLISFSVDLEVKKIDSTRCEFMTHIITLGPQANTYSRSFTVEYGLPARMDNIKGKAGAAYNFVITPLERIRVDIADCIFDQHRKGDFNFNPTANMDIYFVPNSLGDYYWNLVKGLHENELRQFKSLFNLNLPGKQKLFLCPCPLFSVIWDSRFGQISDPTRNNSFGLFTRELNTADPFVIIHTSLLRQYGYAPPFLSEGWAGYLSFAYYDMKKIIKENQNVPITKLLNTYDYLNASPTLADRTASTFVKYLIDNYGFDKFRDLYEESHDLNLAEKFEEVYTKTAADVELEWLTYIDTLTFPIYVYRQFAERAEAMFDYNLMHQYAGALVDAAANKTDSLLGLSILKRSSFFTGDYYAASAVQKTLLDMNQKDAAGYMALAGYKMMNGLYEDARKDLDKGMELNPSDNLIKFNIGMNYLFSGDTAQARNTLLELIAASDMTAIAEAKIMLGYILRATGTKPDQTMAANYFHEGQNIFNQQVQSQSSSSNAFLWLGISSLGLDDTGNAFSYLETALFLETRPFYVGMIYLWMGKTSDIMGDHDAAKDYYGLVLAGPSADYHQKEAKRLMNNPFRQ